MATTEHVHTPRRVGPDRPFMGSVAQEPYTEEDPRAHGNIVYTERCTSCGAERSVASNQGYQEVSTWGPSIAEQKEWKERREENAALEAHDVRLGYIDGPLIQIAIDGEMPMRYVRMDEIIAAAEQPDTGDDLVPLYRGIRRLVGERRAWLARERKTNARSH